MSLIEQLGGYEAVKNIRKKKTSNQYLDFSGRQIHFSKIDRELLEHRRANNIFEVGDKVVSIVSGSISKVMKVELVFDQVGAVECCESGTIFSFNGIRHATDE